MSDCVPTSRRFEVAPVGTEFRQKEVPMKVSVRSKSGLLTIRVHDINQIKLITQNF
jgi:hypothetical protein